jgi:hypothetical protein
MAVKFFSVATIKEYRSNKAFFKELDKFHNLEIREKLRATAPAAANDMAKKIAPAYENISKGEVKAKLARVNAGLEKRRNRLDIAAVVTGTALFMAGGMLAITQGSLEVLGKIMVAAGFGTFGRFLTYSFDWKPKKTGEYMRIIGAVDKRAKNPKETNVLPQEKRDDSKWGYHPSEQGEKEA